MQSRLKGLERIALVYMAVKHAQALSLEQASASLHNAEAMIEQQKAQARRSDAEGRDALRAGDYLGWQMQESQKQFTEWNVEGLIDLGRRREALMLEAAEAYRAGRLQLEQMESVLRDLRLKLDLEHAHDMQRESDDRFLARRWWDSRGGSTSKRKTLDAAERMKRD